MLARLASTKTKEHLFYRSPLPLHLLVNGFLLLVGACQPRIENRSKITKLDYKYLVFELVPSMAFDTIYIVSRRRQRALYYYYINNIFVKVWLTSLQLLNLQWTSSQAPSQGSVSLGLRLSKWPQCLSWRVSLKSWKIWVHLTVSRLKPGPHLALHSDRWTISQLPRN